LLLLLLFLVVAFVAVSVVFHFVTL
jgi:hypothetical protein